MYLVQIAGLGDVEKSVACNARDVTGKRLHTTATARLPSTWIECDFHSYLLHEVFYQLLYLTSCATCRPLDDLIFPMLTRWSLRDAMMHCPYTAARLKTFTDKGKGKLDMLLACMGITRQRAALDYSKHPFTHNLKHLDAIGGRELYIVGLTSVYLSAGMMPTVLKKKLKDRLEETGPTYLLTNLRVNGFRLHWDYKTPLSAADAARILTALLGSHLTRPQNVRDETDAFW